MVLSSITQPSETTTIAATNDDWWVAVLLGVLGIVAAVFIMICVCSPRRCREKCRSSSRNKRNNYQLPAHQETEPYGPMNPADEVEAPPPAIRKDRSPKADVRSINEMIRDKTKSMDQTSELISSNPAPTTSGNPGANESDEPEVEETDINKLWAQAMEEAAHAMTKAGLQPAISAEACRAAAGGSTQRQPERSSERDKMINERVDSLMASNRPVSNPQPVYRPPTSKVSSGKIAGFKSLTKTLEADTRQLQQLLVEERAAQDANRLWSMILEEGGKAGHSQSQTATQANNKPDLLSLNQRIREAQASTASKGPQASVTSEDESSSD